jgi:hypothetical protein
MLVIAISSTIGKVYSSAEAPHMLERNFPALTQHPVKGICTLRTPHASYMFTEIHKVKVKVKVILRPTVSRPVHLGVRPPSGDRDQFFFLLEIFFSTVTGLLFCSALSDERTGL